MYCKQKGFSLVEGLLIMLILCFVSFAGWFVWDRNKDDPAKDSASSVQESSKKEDTTSTVPDGWVEYQGDGFSFIYPKEWDQLDESEWPTDSRPVSVKPISEAQIGGGFGSAVAYNKDTAKWVVKELGRFPGDSKVGDEIQLTSTASDSGATVYYYTEADGPFSSTTLLFVNEDNIAMIQLPTVCRGGCSPESIYDADQITQFSGKIAESVVLN